MESSVARGVMRRRPNEGPLLSAMSATSAASRSRSLAAEPSVCSRRTTTTRRGSGAASSVPAATSRSACFAIDPRSFALPRTTSRALLDSICCSHRRPRDGGSDGWSSHWLTIQWVRGPRHGRAVRRRRRHRVARRVRRGAVEDPRAPLARRPQLRRHHCRGLVGRGADRRAHRWIPVPGRVARGWPCGSPRRHPLRTLVGIRPGHRRAAPAARRHRERKGATQCRSNWRRGIRRVGSGRQTVTTYSPSTRSRSRRPGRPRV